MNTGKLMISHLDLLLGNASIILADYTEMSNVLLSLKKARMVVKG